MGLAKKPSGRSRKAGWLQAAESFACLFYDVLVHSDGNPSLGKMPCPTNYMAVDPLSLLKKAAAPSATGKRQPAPLLREPIDLLILRGHGFVCFWHVFVSLLVKGRTQNPSLPLTDASPCQTHSHSYLQPVKSLNLLTLIHSQQSVYTRS